MPNQGCTRWPQLGQYGLCAYTTHRAQIETGLACCLSLMYRQLMDWSAQHVRQLPLTGAWYILSKQRQPHVMYLPSAKKQRITNKTVIIV